MYAVSIIVMWILLHCVCTCSYEVEVYQQWTSQVEEVSTSNLQKPLLIRNEETSQLKVNFDPEVP